jgi:hypothetical protein
MRAESSGKCHDKDGLNVTRWRVNATVMDNNTSTVNEYSMTTTNP